MKLFKNKIILSLVLMISLIFSITEPVSAKISGSMTDGNIRGMTGYPGGPLDTRTGWMYYLVGKSDKTGNMVQKSDTRITVCNHNGIVDRNGNKVPESNIFLKTVFGGKVKSSKLPKITKTLPNGKKYTEYVQPSWGKPFESNGNGRGKEVKQYLIELPDKDKDNPKKSKAYGLVKRAWGKKWADKWLNEDVALVFEPFYWHCVYIGEKPTGVWVCGTSHTIGKYQLDNQADIGVKGASGINLFTNYFYAGCVMLQTRKSGKKTIGLQPQNRLTKTEPSYNDKLDNETLADFTKGYGIGAVWSDGDTAIDTYDGKNSPGYAEDTTKDKSKQGKSTIYKRYWEKKVLNGEVTYKKYRDDDFITKNTSPKITVTDEEDKGANYKLIGWFTGSSTKDPKPDKDKDITLEDAVEKIVKTLKKGKDKDKNRTQGGSSGTTVEINNKKNEKVLTAIFLKEDKTEGIIDTYNHKDSPGDPEDPSNDKTKQGKKKILKQYWDEFSQFLICFHSKTVTVKPINQAGYRDFSQLQKWMVILPKANARVKLRVI